MFFAHAPTRVHEVHDLHDFSAVHGLQEAVFPGYHANHAKHAKRSNLCRYYKPCKSCRPCKTFQSMQGMEIMQIMQNVQTLQDIETMQIMQIMQVMQKRRKLRSKGRAGPYGRPVVGWRRKKPSPSAAPSGCPLRHSPLCASCATSPARGRGKKQPAGSLACPLTPFIGEIAGAPEGRAYQSERRADGARKKRCAIPLTRSKELFQPDARSDLPHLGPGGHPLVV